MEVLINIGIRESQKSDPERLDPALPFEITLFRLISEMCVTVQLDGKSDLGAVKVETIRLDTMLTSKLSLQELPAPQFGPKHNLRRRHPIPQAAAAVFFVLAVEVFRHRLVRATKPRSAPPLKRTSSFLEEIRRLDDGVTTEKTPSGSPSKRGREASRTLEPLCDNTSKAGRSLKGGGIVRRPRKVWLENLLTD
jgi:hypothetical protein